MVLFLSVPRRPLHLKATFGWLSLDKTIELGFLMPELAQGRAEGARAHLCAAENEVRILSGLGSLAGFKESGLVLNVYEDRARCGDGGKGAQPKKACKEQQGCPGLCLGPEP